MSKSDVVLDRSVKLGNGIIDDIKSALISACVSICALNWSMSGNRKRGELEIKTTRLRLYVIKYKPQQNLVRDARPPSSCGQKMGLDFVCDKLWSPDVPKKSSAGTHPHNTHLIFPFSRLKNFNLFEYTSKLKIALLPKFV